MNAMTGRTIGNYRIIDRLGEGGMGKVYRAIDTMVEREVALKSLKPEIAAQPGILERFRREAVLLARLNHPTVAQLYTFFKEGDEFYMVMEYVAGETLERVIQKRGALPWPEALSYAVQILEGISHAHALGILHRDLKPANVILTPSGKVKLMDFGIAQALGAARLTREGRIVGTLEYLAPERIQGKPADVRSDLYSVGVVLFEMLTGRLPFESDSEYELLLAQVQKQPPAPGELGIDLPSAVESAVMSALDKNPDHRYPDAGAFAAALSSLLPAGATSPVSERNAGLKPTRLAVEPAEVPVKTAPSWLERLAAGLPRTPGKRMIWLGAVCVALLLVVTAVTIGRIRSNRTAPPPAGEIKTGSTAQTAFPPDVQAPSPAPATIPFNPVEFTSAPKAKAVAPKQSGSRISAPAAPSNETTPSDTAAAPAKPVPALTPELRSSAVAALEQTDGPAAGEPGIRPIHLRGLLAALRIGGSALAADLVGPIAGRGVDFPLTAANEAALREAGATPELLRLVAASHVAGKPATPVVAGTKPEPAPAPSEKTPGLPKRVRSLSDIRSIFVDKAPEGLDGHIKEQIRKQLGGVLKLVDAAQSADGVMRVTIEVQKGGAVSGAARVLGIKDRSVVRAVILEPGSTRVLWQQGTGDRKPIIGAFRGESPNSMAERIVRELKEDLLNR